MEYETIAERARHVPIYDTLSFEGLELREGVCRLRLTRQPRFDGIFESLHGGIIMTLADSAAAFAVLTVVEPEESITTTEMSIRFFAPVRGGDHVEARAEVLKCGRTLVPLTVDLRDSDDRRVALAQVTYMRLGKPAP